MKTPSRRPRRGGRRDPRRPWRCRRRLPVVAGPDERHGPPVAAEPPLVVDQLQAVGLEDVDEDVAVRRQDLGRRVEQRPRVLPHSPPRVLFNDLADTPRARDGAQGARVHPPPLRVARALPPAHEPQLETPDASRGRRWIPTITIIQEYLDNHHLC